MSTHNDVTASRRTRILIVDDHEAIRSALVTLLNEEPDLIVVAAAENAEDALDMARSHTIDLAIVDISLGGMNGLELTRQLRQEFPLLCVLILSMHDASLYSVRAMRAGALAYIAKQEASETLVPTIRRVIAANRRNDDGSPPT